MWILMDERLAMPQPAARLERFFDLRIGIEDTHPAKQLDIVEKMSRRADWRVDVETVPHAGVEVVGAVAWRRMNRSRAGIERHVLAQHAQGFPRVKRMLEPDAFQVGALH